jgi:LysM repeat protein
VDGVRLVSGNRSTARFAASAAFLAAAIVAVLLVRSALDDGSPSQPASPSTTQTQGGTAARTTTGAEVTLPAATTAVEPVFYVIEAGDTLETVAEEQGTTVEQLLVLNPDVDPVALTIGQRIRVK